MLGAIGLGAFYKWSNDAVHNMPLICHLYPSCMGGLTTPVTRRKNFSASTNQPDTVGVQRDYVYRASCHAPLSVGTCGHRWWR